MILYIGRNILSISFSVFSSKILVGNVDHLIVFVAAVDDKLGAAQSGGVNAVLLHRIRIEPLYIRGRLSQPQALVGGLIVFQDNGLDDGGLLLILGRVKVEIVVVVDLVLAAVGTIGQAFDFLCLPDFFQNRVSSPPATI